MTGDEGKTREVRRIQDGVVEGAPNTDREGTTAESSRRTRGVNVGNVGTDRPWPTISDSLAGGIIGQLISDTEDRIAEAQECIDWYTREVEKNERRLANLRQLEELASQEEQK